MFISNGDVLFYIVENKWGFLLFSSELLCD
jgi:hypothetical protein